MTLLHLSPNVITVRSLLHLRAVITVRSSPPVKKDARLDRYRSSRVPVSVSVSVSVSGFFFLLYRHIVIVLRTFMLQQAILLNKTVAQPP